MSNFDKWWQEEEKSFPTTWTPYSVSAIAYEAALKEVLAMLPEKKPYSDSPMMDKFQQIGLEGYNKCLSEVRARIQKALGDK